MAEDALLRHPSLGKPPHVVADPEVQQLAAEPRQPVIHPRPGRPVEGIALGDQ